MWNHTSELPDRSYSVKKIQDYFQYIKKHEALTDKQLKGGILCMLLGALVASFLGNLSAGKGVIRAGRI